MGKKRTTIKSWIYEWSSKQNKNNTSSNQHPRQHPNLPNFTLYLSTFTFSRSNIKHWKWTGKLLNNWQDLMECCCLDCFKTVCTHFKSTDYFVLNITLNIRQSIFKFILVHYFSATCICGTSFLLETCKNPKALHDIWPIEIFEMTNNCTSTLYFRCSALEWHH